VKVQDVQISKIVATENYRGKVGDVSELMESIKEAGLVHPIGVIKKGSKFEMVFGNRRLAAVKKIGRKTISAQIISKERNKITLNIVENLQRKDVSMYETGRGINRLITKEDYSENEVAIKIGKPKSFVKNALSVFNITPAEYRDKVMSMSPGSKKTKAISSGVSSTINVTSLRFNLSKDQIKAFYKHALNTNLSNQGIRTICKLMEKGLPMSEAIKRQGEVKTFRAEITMRQDEYDRLTVKHGKDFVGKIFNAQKVDKVKPISKKLTLSSMKKIKKK